MALTPYDEDRHHIGLGPSGDDGAMYGLLLEGGYRQSLQAQGVGTEFGGGTDLLGQPVLSRWNQDDFTGGGLQETWGRDDSCWSSSLNILPSLFDRSVRSCPPLIPWATFNVGNRVPVALFSAKGYLFAVHDGTLVNGGGQYLTLSRWNIETGAREDVYSGFPTITGAMYAPGMGAEGDGRIVIVSDEGAGRFITFWKPTGPIGDSFAGSYAVPVAVTGDLRGLSVTASGTSTGGDLLFGARSNLYSLKLPVNTDDFGTIPVAGDWVRLGRLPGKWRAACRYNGSTYILTGEDDGPAAVAQWDGTSIRVVCEFQSNFGGETIYQFGGRLYVGGTGKDIGGDDLYGELYEITGASQRLVRTFAPQAESQGAWKPKSIYDLTAHEGMLFFGDTGRCLIAYDLVTDAFYGGPQFIPPDGKREVRRLCSARENLFVWVKHPLDATQDGIYRVAKTQADLGTRTYDAQIITSDFAVDPGRLKRFSELRVLTRGGPAVVEYSTKSGRPGGDTFETLGSADVDVQGDTYLTTVSLADIDPAHQIRFRFRLPRGQIVDGYVELIGFTMNFAFLETGKWGWTMTVNATERVERPQGELTEVQPYGEIGQELRRWASECVPLQFRDVDGDVHQAQILRITRDLPVIAQPNTDGLRESFYSVTLVEV